MSQHTSPYDLTPEEADVMSTMATDVTAAMNTAMRAIRTAAESSQSAPLTATITWFVAHVAGQLAARAEFVSINAGSSEQTALDVSIAALKNGRDLAWSQALDAGGIIRANAPTTGAAQ